MGTLSVGMQIVIGILGAGYITNLIAIVSLVINIQQKNQELKEAKLQRLNDNLLQNTRNQIDPLYIPMNKLISNLESKYDDYKIARSRYRGYDVEKKCETKEGEVRNQDSIELRLLLAADNYDAIQALSKVIQELRDYQEKMIADGTIAYLTPDFEKRFDAFLRFLFQVNIIIHTYLLPIEISPIEQPKVLIPGETAFEKELYGEIDYIRSSIRELALGLISTRDSQTKKNFYNKMKQKFFAKAESNVSL